MRLRETRFGPNLGLCSHYYAIQREHILNLTSFSFHLIVLRTSYGDILSIGSRLFIEDVGEDNRKISGNESF